MASCPVCNGLTDMQRYIPIVELQHGLENHCNGCEILERTIKSFAEHVSGAHVILWHSDRLLCLRLLDERQTELCMIELYTEQGQKTPWKIIGPARSVPSVSWDITTAQLARTWLDDCVTRHTICRSPAAYELPTRVLDVVADPVRLYITNKERVPYVALSHCWGGEMAHITTKANLTQHQEGIVFNESAMTFAQAVQVTRDLGMRYLWIDSLCIIQDDAEDWAVEANKMAHVYKNATVTISAEAARATSDGLFASKTVREKHQVVHQVDAMIENSSRVAIQARLRSAPSQQRSQISHSSIKATPTPLSKRAWTLQERLLPNRTLHFYEEELVWSCNSVSRCQCRIDAGIPVMSTFKKLENDGHQKDQLEYDLINEWPDIVTDFTARALTKTSDRLAALSGLATLYHEKTSQEYFAGLWEADMPYALLWMSDHERVMTAENVRRYTPEGDPISTWSWASITGPVRYIQKHKTQFERQGFGPSLAPLLRVLGGSVSRDPLLPFGSAGKGVIVVVGQLLAVNFDPWRQIWRPHLQNVAEPLAEPKAIFDIQSESRENIGPIDEGADYYFLRAATYIKGIMSTNSAENFCILLKRVTVSALSLAFNGKVFERRGVVLFGFGSAQSWSEEQAPTDKLIIV